MWDNARVKTRHICQHPINPSYTRQCRICRAAGMRLFRSTHKLLGIPRKKAIARSYAKVYMKRGKITRMPCEVCNDAKSEMHHPDYGKPLAVRWLCRKHHMHLHKNAAS